MALEFISDHNKPVRRSCVRLNARRSRDRLGNCSLISCQTLAYTYFSIKMSEYFFPLRVTCFSTRERQGVFLVFMRLRHLSRDSVRGRSPSTHDWHRRLQQLGTRSGFSGLDGRFPEMPRNQAYIWEQDVEVYSVATQWLCPNGFYMDKNVVNLSNDDI